MPNREPGCQCHQEEGDSPCRVHGEEGPASTPPAPAGLRFHVTRDDLQNFFRRQYGSEGSNRASVFAWEVLNTYGRPAQPVQEPASVIVNGVCLDYPTALKQAHENHQAACQRYAEQIRNLEKRAARADDQAGKARCERDEALEKLAAAQEPAGPAGVVPSEPDRELEHRCWMLVNAYDRDQGDEKVAEQVYLLKALLEGVRAEPNDAGVVEPPDTLSALILRKKLEPKAAEALERQRADIAQRELSTLKEHYNQIEQERSEAWGRCHAAESALAAYQEATGCETAELAADQRNTATRVRAELESALAVERQTVERLRAELANVRYVAEAQKRDAAWAPEKESLSAYFERMLGHRALAITDCEYVAKQRDDAQEKLRELATSLLAYVARERDEKRVSADTCLRAVCGTLENVLRGIQAQPSAEPKSWLRETLDDAQQRQVPMSDYAEREIEKIRASAEPQHCDKCRGDGGRWDPEVQDQWYWCDCPAAEKQIAIEAARRKKPEPKPGEAAELRPLVARIREAVRLQALAASSEDPHETSGDVLRLVDGEPCRTLLGRGAEAALRAREGKAGDNA